MKKIKLLLLSSIFIVYGTQNAISAAATASRQPVSTQKFTEEQLQDETDPSENLSDATQKFEDARRRKTELTVEIADKQKELQAVSKEEQEASRNAGNEGVERLKRKIAQHMDNIKTFEEQIKQKNIEQAAELDRLKKEHAAHIREITENNTAALREINDQKALSLAKKAAREQELAALKGAKMAGTPQTNQQLVQKGALNAAIQNQGSKPLKKVNAVIDPQANTAPQQVAAKTSGGIGGLFGGLQQFQATIEGVSQKAASLTETATGTVKNAAEQVNSIKGQVADAQESVAGVLPSTDNVRLQSIKIETNTFAVKTISI